MKVVVIGGGDFADGLDRDLDNVDSENEQKKTFQLSKGTEKTLTNLKMNRKTCKI